MDHLLTFGMAALQLSLILGSALVWVAIFQRIAAGRALVEYEPRALVPWSGVDVMVLAIMVIVLESAARIWAAPGSELDAEPTRAFAAVGASRIVWLIVAVIYLSRWCGAYFDDMGLDTRRLASDLRLAGYTFLAAVLPVYGVQIFFTMGLGYESQHPLVKLALDEGGAGVLLLTTLIAVGVAPLVEEFLFRVLLQGWLEKKQLERRERQSGVLGEPAGWGPIIMSAAIFGLMHAGNGPDPAALFVLSLFLGYVYQRTHRIIAPLAVHMCVNGLAMIELWKVFLSGGN